MTGRRSRTPAAPVSYSLLIPLGWIRVPGGLDRDSTLAAVRGQVDDADGAARGWRDEIGPVLDEAFRSDTGRRILDAYVPQGPLPGTSVTCSLVVSVVDLGPPGGDPDQLLLHRAASRGGELLDLDGSPAVRWAEPTGAARPATPAGVHELARDHVLARVPGRADLLLGLTTTVACGDPCEGASPPAEVQQLVEALRLLFAAVVASFAWVEEPLVDDPDHPSDTT